MYLISVFPTESVATVDLQKCFRVVGAATDLDRVQLSTEIASSDQKATALSEAVKAAEASSDNDPTSDTKRAIVKQLKAEFELYRIKEQARLKQLEAEMFNRWLKKVRDAAATVARSDGYTVVLFGRADVEQNAQESIQFDSDQILNNLPRTAFVRKQERVDITKKVLAELMSK